MSKLPKRTFELVSPEKWNLPEVIRQAFADDLQASPQIWLSGGGALRVLLGKSNEGEWTGDWDMYCTPLAFSRLKERSGLHFLQEEHDFKQYYEQYWNAQESMHVFVGKQYVLPTAIYYAFDLTVVRVAISAGGVVLHPSAFDDIFNGVVRVCRYSKDNAERLEKYRRRGFKALPISETLKSDK